jgi:hypothetical protein
MAEVRILKNSRRQAVVSAVGTGTFHCNLSSLLSTVKANSNVLYGEVLQTLDVPNAECPITDVVFTVNGNTTITRNGTTYLILTEGQADFSFSQRYGYVLNANTAQDSNANIQINFGANTGSVILSLTKGPGFIEPNLQLLQDYERP